MFRGIENFKEQKIDEKEDEQQSDTIEAVALDWKELNIYAVEAGEVSDLFALWQQATNVKAGATDAQTNIFSLKKKEKN